MSPYLNLIKQYEVPQEKIDEFMRLRDECNLQAVPQTLWEFTYDELTQYTTVNVYEVFKNDSEFGMD